MCVKTFMEKRGSDLNVLLSQFLSVLKILVLPTGLLPLLYVLKEIKTESTYIEDAGAGSEQGFPVAYWC